MELVSTIAGGGAVFMSVKVLSVVVLSLVSVKVLSVSGVCLSRWSRLVCVVSGAVALCC